MSRGDIRHGRSLTAPFEERVDAVIVGSGAGGSVVACHLAEAGWNVLVLEEGPYYRPEEYGAFRPSESLRRMWRDAGLYAAVGVGQTPLIGLCVGRNVGGSSVHTGGVCFRIPSEVHHRWVRDEGLVEWSEKSLEDAYLDVERRANIHPVDEQTRSVSTTKFMEGAARLGIEMKTVNRNTVDCRGLARCNFGCPEGAKKSADVSYLMPAVEAGARVLSDALVEKILFEGDRAVGIEGALLGGPHGERSHRFKVHASVVIVACGTLHTPLLLEASGIRSTHVGRNITLHPAARVCAFFEERIEGWDGALQSVYCDQFLRDGITMVGVYSPMNILAAGFGGFGPRHRAAVRRLPHMAAFGCMVHDEAGGSVRSNPFDREGIVSYEMAPRDLLALRRAFTLLGEMALAAGAKEVLLPIFDSPLVKDLATLKRLQAEPLDPRRIECLAFHPLGSARMATDPRRGVTTPEGAVHGTRGLYIADGSILPTSIGVNSQEPIMTMATRVAWRLRERYSPARLSS